MFFGDVIRNSPGKGLQIDAPETFNVDTAQTIVDAQTLLTYSVDHVLFSHGDPILGNAGRRRRDAFDERH